MNRCNIKNKSTRCIALACLFVFIPGIGGGEPNDWKDATCSDTSINKVSIRARAIIDGKSRDDFALKANLISFINTGNRNQFLIDSYAIALSSINKIGPPQTRDSYWGRYSAEDIRWIEDVVRECHRIQEQWRSVHEEAMHALHVLKEIN